MKKSLKFLIIILIIGASCFGLYYYNQKLQFDNITYKGIDGKTFVYNKDQKLYCSINKKDNIKNGDEIELTCNDQFLNVISFNKKIIVKDLLTDNLHIPTLQKRFGQLQPIAILHKKIAGYNTIIVFYNKNAGPSNPINDEYCYQTYDNVYQYGELGNLNFVSIKDPENFDINTQFLNLKDMAIVNTACGKDSKNAVDSFLKDGWIRIDN